MPPFPIVNVTARFVFPIVNATTFSGPFKLERSETPEATERYEFVPMTLPSFAARSRLRNIVQNAYNGRPVTVGLKDFTPRIGHAERGLQMNASFPVARS